MESKKHNFSFETTRLVINQYNLSDIASNNDILEKIVKTLTPNVTKALPNGWQNISSPSEALRWIKERYEESIVLWVKSGSGNSLAGFIFIYPITLKDNQIDVRFGYLLSEAYWGKGLGTELIKGLMQKCRELKYINSISGGVEKENMASIKVMEKCGFRALRHSDDEQVVFYQKNL